MRNPFVSPSLPVVRREPPRGDSWQHELKFDGFRVQLHKRGKEAAIFSRGGHDFTSRYPTIQQMLQNLGRRSVIIDAELVACGADGRPDFVGLLKRQNQNLCVWAFDLLEVNGEALSARPLAARRARLERLVESADDDQLRYSAPFDNAAALLATAEAWHMEGIVSKRIDQTYLRAATQCGSR